MLVVPPARGLVESLALLVRLWWLHVVVGRLQSEVVSAEFGNGQYWGSTGPEGVTLRVGVAVWAWVLEEVECTLWPVIAIGVCEGPCAERGGEAVCWSFFIDDESDRQVWVSCDGSGGGGESERDGVDADALWVDISSSCDRADDGGESVLVSWAVEVGGSAGSDVPWPSA